MNLRLSDMGLRGPFPLGVKNCTSLTELDLSSNHLTGQLPSNVSDFMQFLTKLDLSSNNLSGPIPSSFCNLSFINVLRLDNNQLTGQIPLELAGLDRIKEFDVANNRLSGQVPIFRSSSISADSYAGNLGLCGPPLDPCVWRAEKDLFLAGFAVGFPFFTIVTLLMVYCSTRLSMSNMRSFLLMVKKIKGRKQDLISQSPDILLTEQNNTEESKVTSMEKYIRRLSLVELKLATNNFDTKSEIGYGNMGIMYKAVFPNSMMLAVKRLHKFESFEKEFLLEIQILGRLRNTNLVPLLCFCFEMDKKFLVYKYMSNGTLHQWLHSRPQVEGRKMGWTLRLRIAVGIARGLAWLHHNNALQSSGAITIAPPPFFPAMAPSVAVCRRYAGAKRHTAPHMPPHNTYSYKEDVYSFGILLLELVSGQGFDEEIYETLGIAKKCIQTHKNGATSMLEVYQSIRAVGISRNEISVDLYMDLEGNTEDI
ncbi:putative transferase, protein kinase RLK-Pelle-LRR-Xa family [Helianthus annuus]|nr:putative transferase, protein kinase RLK-Pelle-LRR-Xa family [Helianthus annuus]